MCATKACVKQDFPLHVSLWFPLKFKVFFCSILVEWCLIILKRENEVENQNINSDKHLNKESEIQLSYKAEMDAMEN